MMQCGVKGEVNWFRWGIPKITAEITDQRSVTNFCLIVRQTNHSFISY